eukprot:12181350-Alexandrium_andersonii.AAC.1
MVLERRETDLDDLVAGHLDRPGELLRRQSHEVSSRLSVGPRPRAEGSSKPHASSWWLLSSVMLGGSARFWKWERCDR